MNARTMPAVLLFAVLSLVAAPVATAGPVALPAQVVPFTPDEISEQTYPGVDYGRSPRPHDDRAIETTWRVAEGVGNCCETYFTTTPDGRLLDFGGRYIHFTDDRGETWSRVQPVAPLVNGEGAIVAAPGGDVLGVEWDPYSGDHLQFYKYEADTETWSYTEMPLHQPFYDREWIGVLPGPVTVDGATHEYVSFVKGGWPWKEVWFYSTDGLHYTSLTSKDAEKLLTGAATQGPLPAAANPLNDWVQPNTNSEMTSLGGGDLLAGPDFFNQWSLLEGQDFRWSAYTLPDGSRPAGLFHVDSAGRVHNVLPVSDGRGFTYRVSRDGGQTWRDTLVALPGGHAIEEIDFRANLATGVAAVAMRAQGDDGFDQDMVFTLDITRKPRLLRRYDVGLGDTGAEAGVGNAVRFDFESVAIFPDGRLAMSFLDSTTTMSHPVHGMDVPAPGLALELETVVGERIPAEKPPRPQR